MILIRGEYFPLIANKIIYHYDQLFYDPNKIEDGDIVYCDTHYILKYKQILNTKKNLTLITHNSDHCLYDEPIENSNGINVNELKCYSKWFGQNSYSKHVIPIPIGFENTRWEATFGPKTDWLIKIRDMDISPTQLVYFNCNLNTHLKERQECYDVVSSMNYVNIEKIKLKYLEYLHKIKNHMFVISPRGNGLDCHRTWEILMMRRVPILKREGQLEKLYKDIPVLFVDNWNDIDSIDLENFFTKFDFDNQEYLYFDFWKKRI